MRAAAEVWRRYSAYLRRPPELVVRWRDAATDARGWLILNSLRGGAAGGGTRMRVGVEPREVVYLAKAMELKFALAGPPIGGAKAGIDFDPRDPRKGEVLERWYTAIAPYLRECYGTGGDLNVDEVTDVLPCFRRLGLRHPQEGVVRGHLRPDESTFRRVIRQLDTGIRARVNGRFGVTGTPLTVADLVTGYGVARALERLYQRRGEPLDGRRVILEGFGNVGAAAALYLARAGARLVAIADAERLLVDLDGLDAGGVEDLLTRREGKLLPAGDPRVSKGDEARDRFWDVPAEVFVAAALSDTLDPERLRRLEAAGVRVITCGANHPFRERAVGATEVQRAADARFAVLPDILANCGMARTFSYLMRPRDPEPDPAQVFGAVDATVADSLDEALAGDGRADRGLLARTLGLTLDRIGG